MGASRRTAVAEIMRRLCQSERRIVPMVAMLSFAVLVIAAVVNLRNLPPKPAVQPCRD